MSGGQFFPITEKAAREYLAVVCGNDYTIQQHPRGGYVVTDKYRPGVSFYGKTPRAACQSAGVVIIAHPDMLRKESK